MHYYQHHIGDFIRDTANLTDSQVMAYLRLIWMYYDSEKPLPNNAKVLAFKIGSTEETVSLILEAFFFQEDDVWKHSRCESELAEYNTIRDRNIANGKGGGRPKKTQPEPSGFPVGSQSVSSGIPDESQTEPCRNPNHKPVTNNQELNKTPLPPKGDIVDAIALEFEEIWQIIPKRAGDTPSETLKAYRERRKKHSREEIRAGVDRYVAHCAAQKAADPSWYFQKSSRAFFGPGLHFQAAWEIPKGLRPKVNAEPIRRSAANVFG